MFNVVAAELMKIRRPSISLAIATIIGTLSIGFTSFIFLKKNEATWADLAKFDGMTSSYNAVAAFMGFVALTVFASQTSQEYTFGTLRNLLVRQPSRTKLFVGKFLAMSSFAVFFVAFTFIVSVGTSIALAKYQHFNVHSWTSHAGLKEAGKLLLNSFIALIGYGSFGMSLGMILKSPMSAISASLLWFLVIEGIIGSVVKGANQWMPGTAMAVVSSGGMKDFPYDRALIVSAVYVAVFMGISGYLFHSRDVAQ